MSNEKIQAIAVKRYGNPDIPKLGARERDKRCIQIACFVAGFTAGLNERDEWRAYPENKPEIGQLINYVRIPSDTPIYHSGIWDEENERYADWNDVAWWMPIAPLPQPPNK